MADAVTAEAGWAVWSKHPGTRDDYSVLACSGTFSKADFAKIISRYTAGTPDTRAGQGPGALPWVTVSWVGVDDALRLGLAITDQTDQVDGVGRPITRTRYFCVPYEQLKPYAVSYTALYRAAEQLTQLPPDGQPVSLEVPRLTSGQLLAAALGSNPDERVLGTTAALLLNGPVSVVQAEGSTVADRLAFIDAVAILLPYGYRAKVTAGTWADSGIRHRLRLAFTARAKDDSAAVSWRTGAEVPAGDSPGRRYYDQLRELTTGAAAGQGRPLAAVAESMAAETGPQRFEQPEPAIIMLREIDLPTRVRRAISGKTPVDLAELRRVFVTGRLSELDPPRTDLLKELSALGEEQDWPLLRDSLAEANGDKNAVGPVLAQFGAKILWDSEPAEPLVRECLTLAGGYGIADNVLANLVRMPEPATDCQAGVQILAGLTESTVFGAAGPSGYPLTQRQLTRHPAAAAELMAALVAGSRAQELLRWLSGTLPGPLVRAFEFALLGKRGKLAEGDFAELSQLGLNCVAATLRAAWATSRLDCMLPGFTEWVAARGPGGQDERRFWQQALDGLVPADPRQRAYLDTARLSVGLPPQALPPPYEHPDYRGYVDQLAAIWKRLAAANASFPGDSAVAALAGYLGSQPWTDTRQQARAVAGMADRLGSYDRRHVVIGTVASRLEATPAAKSWDFVPQLLDWVRKHVPDAVRNGLLATLADLPADASAPEVAQVLLRAATGNIKSEAAVAALAQSRAIGSPEAVADLLMYLRREFDDGGVDPQALNDWQRRLIDAVIRGEFSGGNPDFPWAVRKLVSLDARYDMRRCFDALLMLTMGIRDGQHELTDEERDDLASLAEDIDAFLRKAPKRSLRLRNVLPGGSRGQDIDLWNEVPQ